MPPSALEPTFHFLGTFQKKKRKEKKQTNKPPREITHTSAEPVREDVSQNSMSFVEREINHLNAVQLKASFKL